MNMQASAFHHAANALGWVTAAVTPPASQTAKLILVKPVQHVRVMRESNQDNLSLRTSTARSSSLHSISGHENDALRLRFAAIRTLQDGWDGAASIAPRHEIITSASHILKHALQDRPAVSVPAIVPVADGGLQVEWYSADHHFEMYFEADGEIAAWLQDRKTGATRDVDGRAAAVQLLIDWAARINGEQGGIV